MKNMSFGNYLKKFEEEKGIDVSEYLSLNDIKDLENSIEKAIKKQIFSTFGLDFDEEAFDREKEKEEKIKNIKLNDIVNKNIEIYYDYAIPIHYINTNNVKYILNLHDIKKIEIHFPNGEVYTFDKFKIVKNSIQDMNATIDWEEIHIIQKVLGMNVEFSLNRLINDGCRIILLDYEMKN